MMKSPRFYRFLFSYCLLVVIVLIFITGAVYANFFDTLRSEVESSTIAKLAQFRDMVELRRQEMNRMALQIGSNPLLKPYTATDGSYGSYEAVGELKQYLSSDAFVRDIVLFYKDQVRPEMYAASGTYDVDLFFDEIYGYRKWSKSDFLQTVSKAGAPVMRPMEPVLFNRVQQEQFATYIVPLPVKGDASYGVALFLIPEDALKTIALHVLTEYNGLLFIINERNEVIFQTAKGEKAETGQRVLQELRKKRGEWTLSEINVDERKFTVVKTPSQYGDWSYVTALPSEQFMSKVDKARRLYEYAVAAAFMLAMLMAFVFSLKQYRPLKKLVHLVSNQNKAADLPLQAKDEIDYISFALGQMVKENEGLTHRLRSHAHALREQALLRCFKGNIKSREEWEELLEVADLRLDHPHFAVLLVLIDDYNEFRRSNAGTMQDILKYSLIKVFEELSLETGSGYGIELIDGRGTVVLLNLKPESGQMGAVRELAAKAKDVYKQYFRFSVTVGVGGICTEFADIPKLYVQAGYAARQRFVKGNGQVIAYDEIVSVKTIGQYLPAERIEQLVKAIKQGDCIEAEQTIGHAFRHIVDNNVSIETAECICFDIVNNITKTLLELEIDIDACLRQTWEPLFVPRFETVEELRNLVTEICCSVCQYIEGQKESKNRLLLEKMKAYIEEQYSDPTIHLDMIAEQFGLSSSYATRFFKDQTGMPIMRYMDDLRMRKTKYLLKTTELPLKEVIAAVGYVDSTNFMRKFKRAEGITPIQYRNLYQMERAQESTGRIRLHHESVGITAIDT